MNILSLYDGMSCGMLAMLKAGIQVDNYYAYEIDKYAIQTSQHNFPEIKQCGDVFKGDYTQYKGIDYLIGGSPCQRWSIAQSPDKRETTASGIGWELFSQYVRALHEAEPKFFVYENNKSMAKAIRESITETFGFEPICINSALVSAQNRQRLYWVGKRNPDGTYSKVDVEQPKDRGILLRDVLDGVTDREKGRAVIGSTGRTTEREYFKKFQGNMAYEPVNTTTDGKAQCLRATCYKDGVRNIAGNDIDKKTGVAEPVCIASRGRYSDTDSRSSKTDAPTYQHYEARTDSKTTTLCAEGGGMGAKTGLYAIPVKESETVINGIDKIAKKLGYVPQMFNAYNAREIKDKSPTLTTGSMETSSCAVNRFENINCYAIPVEFDGDIPIKAISAADGKTNAITTVSKDNLIGEPVIKPVCLNSKSGRNGKLEIQPSLSSRIYSIGGKGTTVTGGFHPQIAIPVKAISAADGKTYTVCEVKDGNITIKGKTYPIKLTDGYYIIRKLTVSECKRLQTVPEWYEFPVSNTQAYKMLGNGWTVDVIAHLIEATRRNETDETADN